MVERRLGLDDVELNIDEADAIEEPAIVVVAHVRRLAVAHEVGDLLRIEQLLPDRIVGPVADLGAFIGERAGIAAGLTWSVLEAERMSELVRGDEDEVG